MDPFDLAAFGVLLAAVGAFAGVLAGLLGVGGGIVIVPALFHVLTALDFPGESLMHVAVATSLATIVPTSLRSAAAHRRKGAVDFAILRGWGPFTAVGAILGVVAASQLRSDVLTGVFGALALVAAAQLALGGETTRLAERPPEGAGRAGLGFGLGFLSCLMGIGGGTFGVPTLTLLGVAMHRAVATAAGFGVVIALPAALGFVVAGWGVGPKPPFTVGYVNLAAFAIVTPMTVLCAPFGARIAHALPVRPLRLAFAFFLTLTALNMLRSALVG